MNIVLLVAFTVLLWPISLSYGFEWSSSLVWNDTQEIPVVILSDYDIESEKVVAVRQVISSEKHHEGFFDWSSGLSYISDTLGVDVPSIRITDDVNEAKITILLSQFNGEKNLDGITRYQMINGKINQALVIIYDSDTLTQDQIQLVSRHEMGHALGLGHTSNPFDLMHPVFDFQYGLISLFDLNSLSEMYLIDM